MPACPCLIALGCPVVQGKEWEARKAELAPLGSEHAELVAMYETDLAKLSEQEKEAQAVLDEAAALKADFESRAIAMAEVRDLGYPMTLSSL